MAKVTPGFKLYLYQLLSRTIGIGKQTLLPQIEEALTADDILPEDLECTTVQEVVEACPEFLKLRVFKKGRVYVTVMANEEWDQMLSAPPEKPAAKKAAAGGPKTWKKKKIAKKTLKPVKPGKQRRDREAAEAQAAAERAAAEAQAAAERAAAEALAASEQETVAQDVAEAPSVAETAVQTEPQGNDESQPADDVQDSAEAPTEEHSDEELASSSSEEADESAPEEKALVAETQQESSPAHDASHPEETVPDGKTAKASLPDDGATLEKLPAAPTVSSPISLTITYDPYEDMERELARQAAEAAEAKASAAVEAMLPAPEIETSQGSSSSTEAQSVSLTPTAEVPRTSAPSIAPATTSISSSADLPQRVADEVSCKDALLRALYQLLPFEVEPLAVLDEDWRVARSTGSLSGSRNRVTFPLHYLHEDGSPITVTLRKTTRNVSGKRWSLALVDGDDGSGVSHEAVGFEGLPAIDEGAWSDLSGSAVDPSISPSRELAQQVVIGSWDSFLGKLATAAAPERWNLPGEGVGRQSRYGILREYVSVTFHRLRCQERITQSADGSFAAFNTGLFTAFGDDLYACLTARHGDIPWQFAGFATAGSGELGTRLLASLSPLPEPPSYLSDIESVMALQSRMVILDLEAILSRQLGRLPRAFLAEQLEGNAEAEAVLLQEGSLSQESLDRLARAIRQSGGSYRRLRRTLDDAVEQSMRSLRESYRLAVPVYDPAENRTKLMVPLCLVEDGKADCALVLDLQPSGAYRAAAILPLPRAYACARVISREQPAWLSANRVL